MISKMNSGKNRYFFYAVMALLVLSLVGFGSIGLQGAPIYSIGKIGDKDISVRDYSIMWSTVSSELAQQRRRALSPDDYSDVEAIVLERLFFDGALDSKVKEMELSISDTALATLIVNDPRYAGLDGKFDKDFYEASLEIETLTTRQNELIIRDGQIRELLEESIQTGIEENTHQPLILLEYALQKRDFNWIALNSASVAEDIPNPTDAQLETYYQDNSQNYQSPLVRKITYAWLSPDMLLDDIDVAEEDLKASYDLQIERFDRPGFRNMDRIVFANDEEAATARAGLDAGTLEFGDIATERGLSEADIRLGQLNQQGLAVISDEAAVAIFAEDETGVYGPYASGLGPTIYRVNAITGARSTSFEDARAELIAEIGGDEARRLIADAVLDLEDQLAAGNTLEELANTTIMQVGEIDFTGQTQTDIAAYQEFREIASKARQNDFPRLIDLPDGGVFALRVDEIIPEQVKPLADVIGEVRTDWIADETAKLLDIKGESLLAELDKGTAMDTLGFDVVEERDVLRSQPNLPLPDGILDDIFALNAGDTTTAQGQGTLYIVQLNAIHSADPSTEENQEYLAEFETEIKTQRASDIREYFIRAVQDDVGLAIDRTSLGFINTQLLSY